MWLQYEVRTDDITCIVIQVVGLGPNPDKPPSGPRMSIRQSRISQAGSIGSLASVGRVGTPHNVIWQSKHCLIDDTQYGPFPQSDTFHNVIL
jgi:hypothetical protein